MDERTMFPAEQVIESIDRVLAQLGYTPWAFRLEEDGTLTSDPDCYYFRQIDDEEEDYEDFFEEYEKKAKYQSRMWEEYGELFPLSPFAFERYEKVQDMDWIDVLDMTWAEILEQFLLEELPLVRAILRADGFWHKPVSEHISDEALDPLIAFRYKERLLRVWENNMDEEHIEEEEDLL